MRRILFAASLLLLAAPALAIDFKAPITQLDGSTIPVSGEDKSPLTLGKVCEDSLVATLPNDQPTPAEKNQRFWIALKIHEGKSDLTADEITITKKVIGLAYGPLVIGRAYALLDPASVPKQ
jgi:hypothetical protein